MPPPWRERSNRKDWKLGRDSSESQISGESHVSTMQTMSGEYREQIAESSSNLGRRLRALKEKIFKEFGWEEDRVLGDVETEYREGVRLVNRVQEEEELSYWELVEAEVWDENITGMRVEGGVEELLCRGLVEVEVWNEDIMGMRVEGGVEELSRWELVEVEVWDEDITGMREEGGVEELSYWEMVEVEVWDEDITGMREKGGLEDTCSKVEEEELSGTEREIVVDEEACGNVDCNEVRGEAREVDAAKREDEVGLEVEVVGETEVVIVGREGKEGVLVEGRCPVKKIGR